MSMISAQCDKLRAMAESVGLAMPQAATLMMKAADTIWELRDDLQRANDAVRDSEHDESCAWDRVRKAEAENARLRSELESVGTAAYLYGRGDLEAENAKLRELVDELYPLADYGAMDASELDRAHDLMRELGVEVPK